MSSLQTLVDDFLAQKRIAVAGVTRSGGDAAELIYRKLRDSGYEVFPINPNTDTYDGVTCYPNLAAIPGGVDGVVLITRPEVTEQIVQECVTAGVPRVWIHRSPMGNSLSETAVAWGRAQGLKVIAGGCPMMFCQPVDFGHKCLRWLTRVTGKMSA